MFNYTYKQFFEAFLKNFIAVRRATVDLNSSYHLFDAWKPPECVEDSTI